MKVIHMAAFVLVILGALNWGLLGLFSYNLVETVFGSVGGLSQVVYVLVGVSAVYIGVTHPKDCKVCSRK